MSDCPTCGAADEFGWWGPEHRLHHAVAKHLAHRATSPTLPTSQPIAEANPSPLTTRVAASHSCSPHPTSLLGLVPALSTHEPESRAPDMTSVFADFDESAYPHRFSGTLLVGTICGGTPTDAKVAEGWLRTKLEDKGDIIRDLVAEVMVERGVDIEEATAEVDRNRHLNGFRRDENGLYIEGRQLKAAIKEAANVRWAGERWGPTRKGTAAFFAEHVFVLEQRLHLGVTEPSGVMQRFVHTWRGSAIQYEEYVEDAKVDFTIATDFAFTDKQWAMLWLTGERQGIGASRSQGYGCYQVVRWENEGPVRAAADDSPEAAS